MIKLRLLFVALALLVAVPTLFLVHRSRESLRAEHALRYQAVADRVFDEMERALSVWLAEEDARPTEHYRFYVESRPDRGRSLSPLAAGPSRPFVIGYFQIDSDGSFHTPERPRDIARAERLGDFSRNPSRDETLESLQRRVGAYFATWNASGDDRAREDLVDAKAASPAEAKEERAPSPAGEPGLDVYSTLKSLNQASESRRQRKTKRVAQRIARSAAPSAEQQSAPPPPEIEVAGRSGWNDGFSGGGFSADALEAAVVDSVEETEARPNAASPARTAPAKPSGGAIPETPLAVVEIDPLSGYHLADHSLLLMRSVRIRFENTLEELRQGMLVDPDALHRWLREDALAAARLGEADFSFRRTGEARPVPDEPRRAVHRFAEPFDAWELELSLAPLSGLRTEKPLFALSAAVLITAALGLIALYRMVSVRLAFAERRSNFAAAVSHELKTPLTAIRMYAEMLRDDMVPDEAKRREYYRSITAEAERLSRLINNVLEYSKLEQNERVLEPEVGDPGRVVSEVMRWLAPHAKGQNFELDVRVASGVPDVRFERDALLQILFNLVDNAIKYAREATQRIVHVTCGPDGDAVVVAVRDHGPGVSGEHLPRIFDAFYRGESELTRTSKGTGIGLALAKRLAEQMGATLSGRNVAEGGFEVRLRFPAAASST